MQFAANNLSMCSYARVSDSAAALAVAFRASSSRPLRAGKSPRNRQGSLAKQFKAQTTETKASWLVNAG